MGGAGTHVFLAKLGPDGSHLWSKAFGGSGSDSFIFDCAAAVDASGNVLLTGGFRDTPDFGGGALSPPGDEFWDGYIAKFDASGKHLWSKRFGGAGGDWGVAVGADGFGNVVLTGIFQSSVDLGGGPLVSPGGALEVFVAKFAP